MRWRRMIAVFWGSLLLPGCPQESYRPSAEDLLVIQKNILPEAPKMKHRVQANLEGKVVYLGLDADPEFVAPGKPFTLTHYWQVNEPVRDWNIFVHLNDPARERFINADHVPIGGRYPVSQWKPGEIVRDEHAVSLPADWPHDRVVIYTGLWRGELRMKVDGPHDGEDRVIAATLPVQAIAAPRERKRILAVMTAGPIRLDGKLDEPVWKQAVSGGPFVDPYSGAEVPEKTEVRAAWDRENLYLAFTGQDQDVFSSLKKRDERLWTQDAVEVFIDASGDGRDYVELQVNPNGAVFDSYFTAPRQGQEDFDSKLSAAVAVDGTLDNRDDRDRGWTVEMALPLKEAWGRGGPPPSLPPRPEDVWRVNFFRVDVSRGREPRTYAWAPPRSGDFHLPGSFGELVFVEAPPRAGVLPKSQAR